MAYKRINITLPEAILPDFDAAVLADYSTRSGYIYEALLLKFQIDEAMLQQTIDIELSERLICASRQCRGLRKYKRAMRTLSYAQVQE